MQLEFNLLDVEEAAKSYATVISVIQYPDGSVMVSPLRYEAFMAGVRYQEDRSLGNEMVNAENDDYIKSVRKDLNELIDICSYFFQQVSCLSHEEMRHQNNLMDRVEQIKQLNFG